LEVLGVLAKVGVDVLKIFGIGTGVSKPETGVESDLKKICHRSYLRGLS